MISVLQRIKQGEATLPPRITLAGPEGIGKSTFASQAPKPLFLSAEEGLTGLEHVSRISPTSLVDLLGILDGLEQDMGGHKTLVIDTADWLERLVYAGMCLRDNKANIEDYGYGKGFTIAESEFSAILGRLDRIRQAHKVVIIILSHVQIRTFKDPSGGEWDRYEMKGNKKVTGILREWADACLFAVTPVFKTKDKSEKSSRAVSGERVIHTVWSPAWDAKNRLNLPPEIPFPADRSWAEFAQAVEENSISSIRSKVNTAYAAAAIPEAEKAKWSKWIANVNSAPIETLKGALAKLETLAATPK